MQTNVNDSAKVSHFLAFYLIHSIQVGVGILGFQRNIARTAGYDAWMAIILAGVLFHIVIWIMYKMLNMSSGGDLVSIHREIFGKWLGGLLSICFMIYFVLLAISILKSFILVMQVWMFPDLRSWEIALIYLILIYYAVSKGFRVVTGVCFLGVVIPAYLYVTFIPPFGFGDARHLLPIYTHSFQDILGAAKQMTYSYLGIETFLLYYPFLKNPQKSQKWAHIGNFITILAYLLITFATFVYYSEGKLAHTIWATLTMWKIVSLPVIERFEIIGITTWIVVILPNLCLLIWSASRIGKRISSIRQKTFLIGILLLAYVPICMIVELETTYKLTDKINQVGFYIVYAYIPMLCIVYLLMKKVKKKRE
ncbi:GerAB/ArcD/ProY family transporter [Fredinandcohnia humi]